MFKRTYEVDGDRFSTLSECALEFTKALSLTIPWEGNLDAFDDILHGGFGTPDEGFILVWRNSGLSQQRLGYRETVPWLEEQVRSSHPSNMEHFQKLIASAQNQEGETLFDRLVAIIRGHDDIELRLE